MAPERTNPTIRSPQDQDLNDGTMARTLSPRPGTLGVNPRERVGVTVVNQLREIKIPSLAAPIAVERLFASPPSVVANGVLKTENHTPPYQVHMFEHRLSGFVPHRIAAVVPGGVTEFTRALIFFHPLPTQRAGYEDAEYFEQTGGWHNLYRYCDQQGVQLAASGRNIVLIFPIFNLASTDDCGRFPEDWKSLVEEIMGWVRLSHRPGLADESRPILADVITASFSAGVKYHHTFLTKAANLGSYLREVYDYDGRYSSHKDLSEKLNIHSGAQVTTYDQHEIKPGEVQNETTAKKGIHLPEWRWKDKEIEVEDKKTKKMKTFRFSSFIPGLATPKSPKDASDLVHGAIPRFMMFHSLSQSKVGK